MYIGLLNWYCNKISCIPYNGELLSETFYFIESIFTILAAAAREYKNLKKKEKNLHIKSLGKNGHK